MPKRSLLRTVTRSHWRLLALVALAGPAASVSLAQAQGAPVGTLTAAERAAGWRPLFNGRDFTGWHGLGRDSVATTYWKVENGVIHKIARKDVPVAAGARPPAGGDLVAAESFGNFELAFEWKISPGGNSGVKYNVSEAMTGKSTDALGFEYQVLDDDRHPDAKMGVNGNRTAGGLYDLIPPVANKPIKPVGEWNEGRIVFRGNHGEHWLNGVKTVEYELGTPRMNELLAASKYAKIPGFADRRQGQIVLQDHQDEVWYRNLRIRALP
jgi:hypothetical protein